MKPVAISLSLAALLTGCSFIKDTQAQGRAEISHGVRLTFRDGFMDQCGKDGRFSKRVCACMEARLEKRLSDEQLLGLMTGDSEDVSAKKLQTVYNGCTTH